MDGNLPLGQTLGGPLRGGRQSARRPGHLPADQCRRHCRHPRSPGRERYIAGRSGCLPGRLLAGAHRNRQAQNQRQRLAEADAVRHGPFAGRVHRQRRGVGSPSRRAGQLRARGHGIERIHRPHARPRTNLHDRYKTTGTVIQAYLYRSREDVEMLCARGIRVRLCKGAYLEPPSVAFKSKAEVDRNFVELMNLLLETGVYPAIATHDEKIVEQTKRFVESRKISRDSFEFQMLYGIRRDIQKRLVNEGYRLRLYVPYGQAWYPYFMRRLAERPANVFFLVRNLVRS